MRPSVTAKRAVMFPPRDASVWWGRASSAGSQRRPLSPDRCTGDTQQGKLRRTPLLQAAVADPPPGAGPPGLPGMLFHSATAASPTQSLWLVHLRKWEDPWLVRSTKPPIHRRGVLSGFLPCAFGDSADRRQCRFIVMESFESWIAAHWIWVLP